MCVVRPQEVWLLSRERELKEDLRRERDKEIELAIWTLEEETSKDKEECERAAENRCVCVFWVHGHMNDLSSVQHLHICSFITCYQPPLCTVVRVKRVREKYEAELRDLERSERAAVEKQQELRKQQMEMEGELIRLQALLRQKEQEAEDITQVRNQSAE